MSVYWESPPITGLVVATNSKIFGLSCPPRSRLVKLIVLQTAGSRKSFTVELFNSNLVGDAPAPNDGDELYRVCDPLTSNTTEYLRHFFPDMDTYFISQDPPIELGQARTLYMRITITGGGAGTFTALMGAIQEAAA